MASIIYKGRRLNVASPASTTFLAIVKVLAYSASSYSPETLAIVKILAYSASSYSSATFTQPTLCTPVTRGF